MTTSILHVLDQMASTFIDHMLPIMPICFPTFWITTSIYRWMTVRLDQIGDLIILELLYSPYILTPPARPRLADLWFGLLITLVGFATAFMVVLAKRHSGH